MTVLNDAARAAITSGRLAHLVTLNADGSAQLSAVWVGLDGDAAARLQQLAHVYLGPDVTFPPGDNHPMGLILRITPERVSGVGPWSS